MYKFWVVWNPQDRNPMYKHGQYQAAKDEAKRLARLNPDQEFHVLEQVGMAKKNDVSFFVHEEPGRYCQDDEIPF